MIPHTSLTASTGLTCPQSGLWESMGNFKTTCLIAKGHKMPDYCGCRVKWKLIQLS